ncbi:MAG: hypothetical protein PHO23_02005 [Candidatus Pacebacteria bacterium]|nr:hypothetical protein [Candidatus Paceibacterota bacterium]
MNQDIFVGLGFNEINTYAFLNDKDLKYVSSDIVELKNYLSEENKYMTPCLYIPMVKAVSFNYINFSKGKLFEIDKVFEKKDNLISQKDLLSFCVYDDKKNGKHDLILEAKGYISAWLEKLGISDDLVVYALSEKNDFEKENMCLDVLIDTDLIMKMYVLSDNLLNDYSIKTERKDVNCVVVECLIEKLFEKTKKEIEFSPIPRYQASIRDICLNVRKDLMVGDVYVLIRSLRLKYLEDIDLFDVYENDDNKNISFHLVFRASDHTLTTKEIEESMEKIYDLLNKNNIKIR